MADAHLDRIDGLHSLRSAIARFQAGTMTWIQWVRRDAEGVVARVVASMNELENRRVRMDARLQQARAALHSCHNRQQGQSREERDRNPVSCDMEAAAVERYERAVEMIERACNEGRQSVDRARMHLSMLDSAAGVFEGRTGQSCVNAQAELSKIAWHAGDYIAVKANVEKLRITPSHIAPQGGSNATAQDGGRQAATTTKAATHLIEVPEEMTARYRVENGRATSVLVSPTTPERRIRVSRVDGTNAVLSTLDNPSLGLLDDVERILRANGVRKISLRAAESELGVFLTHGFVLCGGAGTGDSRTVEKIIA